uniref:Adipocyte plasma membrane-associated protein n=2 Tax=Cyprinus carpio TaxID=7962 RepID=A0A9J7X0R3_CYPCA
MNESEGLRFRRLNRPQIITDETHEPQYKATSTYSGKVFRVTLLTLVAFLFLPLLVVVFLLESPIQPDVFSLNEPPLMTGCYEPNLKLRQAERLFEDRLIGPESLANIGDVLYTGTADGKIVKIEGRSIHVLATLGKPPCGSREYEHTCGRPLGIRVGPNGTLFVADAYLGLFEVNPVTGKERESTYSALKSHYPFNGIIRSKYKFCHYSFTCMISKTCMCSFFSNGTQLEKLRHLYTSHPPIVHSVHICLSLSVSFWLLGEVKSLVSTGKMIGGRRLGFVNDLDVTQDGKKLYFTDSSSRWQRRDFMHLIMEATADGRVLEYDIETKEVTVMMENLRFPNGIQLFPDEESVLVAETTMARIRRVHVSGLNKGGMDTFIDNLPGFPDNIRRSSSGGYWVAMSAVRPNPGFSMLDFLSQRPWLKKLIFKLFSQDTLLKFVPRYSLVVELQDGGTCVRSFHDPHGMVAAYISEAHEYNGHLYLGSFRSPYLCKLDLSKV